ncbi:MAG: hypothetical protein AABW90_02305 [Nanoarchaeota archaeon]
MKKKGFRLFLVITLILLIIINLNLVFASITIEASPEKTYHLGQKIDVDISVISNQETQAIISSEISCANTKLNYFRTPSELTTNGFINIPALTVNKNFLGVCKIIFSVLDSNEKVVESMTTENIEITNILPFNFSTDKDIYSPEEKVIIEGKLEKGAELKVFLKDGDNEIDSFTEVLDKNFFTVIFELTEDISKGEKNVFINVEDKYGNTAIGTKKIEILQIARSLKFELEKKEIMPYENLTLTSHIYDQSAQEMILEINYKILSQNEKLINAFNYNSNEQISFGLDNPPPGEYVITASYKELEDIEKFFVLEFREIELEVENGIITAANIGNVRYIENLIINASVKGVIYQIPISLYLKVNEKTFIDLKTELSSENYDVTLFSKNKSYYLGNLKIDDNRPLTKKISQGLSGVTGSTAINTDEVSNVFYLGFFLVFIIIVVFVIFFLYKRFKRG